MKSFKKFFAVLIFIISVCLSSCTIYSKDSSTEDTSESLSVDESSVESSFVIEKGDVKEINEIYIAWGGFGKMNIEYKINLVNKEFWKYRTGKRLDYVERDITAENEGFEFVSSLDEEKIKTFANDIAEHGFFAWKEGYSDYSISDGTQWRMKIDFKDGTEKNIYGSNACPPTWKEIREDFMKLTGENVIPYMPHE